MSNSSLLMRSLVIYALCAAAAVIFGLVIANIEDVMSFYMAILLLGLMLVPMLLRWHHFWLISVWNMSAVLFFVPGRPTVVLAMAFVSLGISILQRALNRKMELVRAPTIALPMLALMAVILVTAKLTGGIGLNVLGSSEVGGKRYVYMLAGIVGYFALAAHRIPPQKAVLCVVAFYLFGATQIISDMAKFIPPSAFYYILLVFPPTNWWEPVELDFVAGGPHIGRLPGVGPGCLSILFCMMAVYGIGGIFKLRHFWRLPVFLAAVVGCMYGGYRTTFVHFCLAFGAVFCLEGVWKSRYLPGMVCGFLLIFVCALPFTDKLPLPMQRCLTVIPGLKLDQFAKDQAEDTTEWRERLWLKVLPEVPHYLLLGKGLSISASDFAGMSGFAGTSIIEAETTIMASDFHSGPLSVIIPFGLAGALSFLWLLGAGFKGLYNNYRYGDPELQRVNTFLLAAFAARTILFLFVFGSLFGDLLQFTGILGVSMAINGGVRKPVPVTNQRPVGDLALSPAHAHVLR